MTRATWPLSRDAVEAAAIQRALVEILKLTEERRAEAQPREVRAQVTFALQEAYRRIEALTAVRTEAAG